MAVKPYERQDYESDKAWAAFQAYRDQDPKDRTVIGAYRALSGRDVKGSAPWYWRLWAKNHDWEGRSVAWDRAKDEAMRQEEAQELVTARKRQASLFRDYQRVLGAPVLELVRRIENGTVRYEDMQAKDLIALALAAARYLPNLADAELRARGDAGALTPSWTGEVQEVRDDVDQMKAVWAVLEAAGVRPQPQQVVVETTAEVRELPRAAGE